MTFKPEQAQAFYSALTGEANPLMTWQTFCDYEKVKDDPRATWWNGYFDPARLADSQAQGCGVFTTINGGGRYAADIKQFRAVFMDSDGIPLPSTWVVPPHAIVMRDPTHYHAYWFLDGDCSPAEWSIAQKQIGLHYGGDLGINNLDRVMRVPGFLHQKDLHAPALYELTYLNTEIPRYKLRNIIGNFTLTPDASATLATWINQRNGQYANEVEDYDDCEANTLKYIEYLTQRAEHGIDGQGRNHIRFKTAAAGRDYGLSPEKTIELMLEHWDAGNSPPCGEELIDTSVRNAYRYNQNRLGSRSLGMFLQSPVTPLAGMSDTPTQSVRYVPESVAAGVVGAPAALVSGQAPGQLISPDDAAGGFYSKNHTQNAITFIQANSPNGEIILSDDDIYVFNGSVFDVKDGKYLQGVLAKVMEFCTPSSADVDGSVSMIKNHLRRESPQKWPEWKEAPDRDTSGLIVFSNGVLDILTNEWFTHTPLLRARNLLPYDYDYAATCPKWEGFLNDLWGNSQYEPLIDLLQQWFGYLLTDDQSQQKMAIFVGKPRSGKGTIMRVIEDMLGAHNCTSPSIESLTKDSLLHDMSSKMAAIFNDVSDPTPGSRSAIVGNLKRIVGEDSLAFDRKYKSGMTMRFRCRVNMTCNAIPNLSESSTAMLDRGLFFYTPMSHAGSENLDLGKNLKAEMPGIINWAIRGLNKLRAKGKLINSPCMNERIRVFRAVTSPLDNFVHAELIIRPDAYVPMIDVFRRYKGWAIENDGGGVRSMGAFARLMDAMKNLEMGFDGETPVLRGAFLKPLDIEPEMGHLP